MPDGYERSSEEREAARIERERRRAVRSGRATPEPPPPPEAVLDQSPAPAPDEDGYHSAPEPGRDDAEAAAGTRRVSRLDRVREGTAAPMRLRRRGGPRISRGRTRAGRIVAVVAIVLGLALLWFLNELFQPFHGSGHGGVTVTIPPHSSSSQVGSLLARDGVISSGFFFELRATLAGERGSLRSGTYRLQLDMGYGDVLKILTTPPPPIPTTQITIIPGRTRFQIDRLLRTEGVPGSYLALTRRSKFLRPQAYGAPANTNTLEGFLFPDSYTLAKPIRLSHLVADQLRRFKQQFTSVNLGYASSRRLSAYDVLIIASMIEGEAQLAKDRPLIASVIYNRLRLGMPLQIDATTRYATGNYSRPLTQSELHSPSPYNTYSHRGLPPTPIDNPAVASMQAAAHPAQTNFLYFVVKPCGNGGHVFASTYQQFQQEVAQYYAARAKRGGRSPATC